MPAGLLAGTAVSGDCQASVCDGQGGITAVADDADVPSDGNPCTLDSCAAGQPGHAPMPAGTACGPGGALWCNGAGTCVGCLADADCGISTACAAHTCDAALGDCVVTYVPSGQGDPGGQTAGDCQRMVCNGSGGVVNLADAADVPDDGNPCTADACAGGVPGHAPLAAGAACGPGLVCDGAGSCVGCLADADCGVSTVCAAHLCQAGACVTDSTPAGTGDPGGQVAGDCQKVVCNGAGGTTTLPDDADVPDDGNPCTADTCSGGAAHHLPASGASCGSGLVCSAGSCLAGCLIGGILYPPGAANPGSACQACAPTTSTSAWTSLANGAACSDGDACTTGDHCAAGACVGTAHPCAPTSCQTASTCDGNGGCVVAAKPLGTACVTAPAYPGLPTGPGVCSAAGQCISGCFVNGSIYPSSMYFLDTQICLNCNPSQSLYSLYTGGCHFNSINGGCSGAGVCVLGTQPGECSDPTVKPCGGGYCKGLAFEGAACTDDGNSCTSDVCNNYGFCIHPPQSGPGCP